MLDMVKITRDQLFWAAAVPYKMHPGLGALWFLVVLFWSKVLFYVIRYYFTLKYHYIFLISVFVGASISRKFWLPQSFDLVLVTVGFVYIGWLLKEKKVLFEKYQPIITYVAFVIWILCWQKGIYIELGTRSYPYFIVCIVEAFAGCICIFSFSKFLDRYSNLVEPLKIIGLNTLTILCVHHIDYFVPGIGQGSLLEICLRRILFDISFSLLFALLVKKTKIGFSS